MQKDVTEIVIVMDRSGSMADWQKDAEGGLNSFVREQAAAPGTARITLVQFDTEYEVVFAGVPAKEVPTIALHPRGGTALVDAVGRAVNDTGRRLAALPESERPGLVVVAIVTDGEENSSREFRRDQIRQMIEHQQGVYGWRFTFLGADANSFAEAASIGIAPQTVCNYSVNNREWAKGLTSNVLRARSATLAGAEASLEYTEAERAVSLTGEGSK
jgi:hypothetical protein